MAGKSTVDGSVAPWSARTDAAVRWIGWHAAEIAVVGGTAVAGLAAHPVWWAVTVPAVVGWIAHEYALRRRQRRERVGEPSTPAANDASGPAGDDASRVDAGLQVRRVGSAGGTDASGDAGVTRQNETTGNENGEVRRGLA